MRAVLPIAVALVAGILGWFLVDLLPGGDGAALPTGGRPSPPAGDAGIHPGNDEGGAGEASARDRIPAPSDPGPSGLPTTRDPLTGAARIVLPAAWPRAGRLRWELAGNRSGEAYGHVLDAGWRLGEEDAVHLDDLVVDGRPVADALTVARHRGVLAVREESPRDPVVRRLALDACRHLVVLVTELPVGEQELGAEFAFGGSRFRLAAGPDGGARFLPAPTTEAVDVIEVSRIEDHLRVMRTSHDRDESLRVVRRLHVRFDR